MLKWKPMKCLTILELLVVMMLNFYKLIDKLLQLLLLKILYTLMFYLMTLNHPKTIELKFLMTEHKLGNTTMDLMTTSAQTLLA